VLYFFWLLITITFFSLISQGFKRAAFKKAASAAVSAPSDASENIEVKSFGNTKVSIPHELLCPISFTIMVNDPVVARDGHTYERVAIEDWFERVGQGPNAAVRSPIRDDLMMENLTLVSNSSLRTMARDYARAHPNAD
jgi:hypothetical protein